MASRAARYQITTFAFIEGSFNMLWDQRYRDRPDNATFGRLHRSLVEATSAAIEYLRVESGGVQPGEHRLLKTKMERLHKAIFEGRPVDILEAIAMGLDLLGGILKKLPQGSAKYRLTDTVWRRVRAFERYYNRTGTYDDPAGLRDAEIFNRIMNE